MGDRSAKFKWGGAAVAAVAGAVLAATVATAQGPGDYEPTTTTTTTLPGPGAPGPGDGRVDFRADARAGKLRGYIRVTVECDERCWVSGRGHVRLTKIPGARKGSANFRLGRDRASTPDAGEMTLRLKVPKFARRQANAKDFDGRTSAKIVVKGRDASGNSDRDRLGLRFENGR